MQSRRPTPRPVLPRPLSSLLPRLPRLPRLPPCLLPCLPTCLPRLPRPTCLPQ